jgi:hypothetical protein
MSGLQGWRCRREAPNVSMPSRKADMEGPWSGFANSEGLWGGASGTSRSGRVLDTLLCDSWVPSSMLGHLSLSTNREAKVYLQICRPFNCLACSSWGPKTTYTLYFFHDNSRQHSFMADEPSTYLVQSLLTCDNSEGGPLFLLGEWRC